MAIQVHDDNLISALRQHQVTHSEIGKQLARIASGLRIQETADDAAGASVAERINLQSRGLNVASRNIQDFASLVQTADAGLSQIQDLAGQINDLSGRAANGTLNAEDRKQIQTQIDQVTQEIDRFAESVEFNGQKLLSGAFSGTVQLGANAPDTLTLILSDARSDALGLAGLDVTTAAGVQTAIGVAQGAVNTVATERADIGSTLRRLDSALNTALASRESQTAAQARIEDADAALELVELTLNAVRENAGLLGTAQGNINRQNAGRLLE
ncbi:MAG: hypothetical protein A3G34_06330 [Candidatus Lindowbacteria bacterium RIFCSPLOWO2_12_FULL_62_27]|nr:MAG: hypothetical protein A3G34_06330 [Candidatus Lindowbacteria bacterium RIFCSPLOWO2_12_FULL_62_27]OGH58780.1 MAG: hypothetical protein A3I06_09725 [Candidatus Lindowbacteria bacterium RIFCSPLOWO2_02_FULL_62_12]